MKTRPTKHWDDSKVIKKRAKERFLKEKRKLSRTQGKKVSLSIKDK